MSADADFPQGTIVYAPLRKEFMVEAHDYNFNRIIVRLPEKVVLDALLDRQWGGNEMTFREGFKEVIDAFDQAVAHKLIGQITLNGPGGRILIYAGTGSMLSDFMGEP